METVTTRYNWLNTMDENAIRKAAAKFIPAKYFDEYFTPESAPAGYLRSMLEDVTFENNLTPEDMGMNTTTATENNTTALQERIDYLTKELQAYYNCACKGGDNRRRNMILLRWDIRKMGRQLQNA